MEEVPKRPLEYQPLRGSEIRLVRYHHDHADSKHIELEIGHYAISEAPPYLALSYVWGDPKVTLPITVNDQSLQVTENLYNGLVEIRGKTDCLSAGLGRERGDEHAILYLWIDALCINQSNKNERSTHVPRMAQIYSSAYTVLVWLGIWEEQYIERSERARDLLQTIVPLTDFPQQLIAGTALASTYDEHGLNLDQLESCLSVCSSMILENPWFSRLWVLQEYLLSRRTPLALLRSTLFALPALIETFSWVAQRLTQHPASDAELDNRWRWVLRWLSLIWSQQMGPPALRQILTSATFRARPLAEQLRLILTSVRVRKATLPHDQIYGYLGLVDATKLPAELQPDYNRSYGDIYRMFTRYFIDELCDLSVLSIDRSDLVGQPSWVVDFRHTRIVPDRPRSRHSGHFSADGTQLVVDGKRLSDVVLYFDGASDEVGERLREFYDTVVVRAANISGTSPAIRWHEWLEEFLEVTEETLDPAQPCPQVEDFSMTATGGEVPGINVKLFHAHFKSRLFCLSGAGDILECARSQRDQGLEAKHEIWAVKGATQFFILCHEEGKTYRLFGIVHHYKMLREESVFEEHGTERIVLV